MKKKNNFFVSLWEFIKSIVNIFTEDRVTVYSAQATFFVIISTVPFISLVLSIVGLILPNVNIDALIGEQLSDGVTELLGVVLTDLQSAPNVPLLSISAVITLWCASRGITAIRDGIGTVYRSKPGRNFFTHRFISFIFTILFIVFIILFTLIMLFGDFLAEKLGNTFITFYMKLRFPFFIIVMTVFFTGFYSIVAKRSKNVRTNPVFHIPGALFSALGWIVFSYFYSLYILNFPSASYIYGSLAALCLIMLWLYFCMIILLCGAEINRLFFAGDDSLRVFKKKKEYTSGLNNTIDTL